MQHHRSPRVAAWARAALIVVALLGVLGMHGMTADHEALAMPRTASQTMPPAMPRAMPLVMPQAMPHAGDAAAASVAGLPGASAHGLAPDPRSVVAVHDQPTPAGSSHHGVDLCLGVLAAAIGLLVLVWSRRPGFMLRRARTRRLHAQGGTRAPPPLRRLSLSPYQLSVLRT